MALSVVKGLTSRARIQLHIVCRKLLFYHFVFILQFGATALMFASTYGHTDIVGELLSAGAKVDLQDEVRCKINRY